MPTAQIWPSPVLMKIQSPKETLRGCKLSPITGGYEWSRVTHCTFYGLQWCLNPCFMQKVSIDPVITKPKSSKLWAFYCLYKYFSSLPLLPFFVYPVYLPAAWLLERSRMINWDPVISFRFKYGYRCIATYIVTRHHYLHSSFHSLHGIHFCRQ